MTTADIVQIIAAVGSVLTGLLVVAGGFWLQSLAKKVATTEQLTVLGDKKLNRLASQTEKVVLMVDGPLAASLRTIAARDERLAGITGSVVDEDRAVLSREKAETHDAHTQEVIASTDAATAATVAQTRAIEERSKRRD